MLLPADSRFPNEPINLLSDCNRKYPANCVSKAIAVFIVLVVGDTVVDSDDDAAIQ